MKYLLILLGLAFCHTSLSQVKPYKNKWDLKTSSKTTYTKKQKKSLIQFFEENIDATCFSSKDIEFFKGNKEYFLSVKMKAGKLELYYY